MKWFDCMTIFFCGANFVFSLNQRYYLWLKLIFWTSLATLTAYRICQ